MKSKTIKIVKFNDCNECKFVEFPENKQFKCSGYFIRLSEFVLDKKGEKIPNPIIARCGVSGKMLTALYGCNRWFEEPNRINIINYNEES